MKTKAYAVLAYGCLLLIGGIMGYVKAQSTVSLVAGTVCALLAFFSGWAMLRNYFTGYKYAIALTIVLSLFFGYRFYESFKFMPAGLMTLLSIALYTFLISYQKRSIESKAPKN